MAIAVALLGGEARAGTDPNLLWQTIETPHFRITFYSQSDEVAQHVAHVAEHAYDTLRPYMGWTPKTRTEIVLTDGTDSANGSATALPYNAVRLNITAPDDLAPLGDVDDWMLELVTHEYTHVLHTDQIRGFPAVVNAILGKTLAPNQVQPRWILEGLAVHHESARTSGGRLRSSQWDMFLRADILAGNVATLDQVSSFARRWPQGNLWYLYGSYFTRYIADVYGDDALRVMAREYGKQVIPWGINRAIQRATGKTYVELYPEFLAAMTRRYRAQVDAIRARGLREGVRLTHHGQVARYPKFIPRGAIPGHDGDLLYYRDDAHDTQGLHTLPLLRDTRGRVAAADEKRSELWVRTNGIANAAFTATGELVFSGAEIHNQFYAYSDLFRLPRGEKSTFFPDGARERLTDGFRAQDPTTSPDGRRVAFVINHRGTRHLQVADLSPLGLTDVRTVVKSERFEQIFTPRFSPDGSKLVYGAWSHGGYRDVRVIDLRTMAVTEITRDRAHDGGPVFTPDGAYVVFHSDRTGVSNLYAWHVATQKLSMVTNVIHGAYSPDVSPDGKTIAYVGYTHRGFDVFAIPFDPASFLEAPPYVDDRPPVPELGVERTYPKHEYEPWHTLVPRRYAVEIAPSTFGQAFVLSAGGSDIAGLHALTATTRVESDRPELQGSLAYAYSRLRFDVTASAFRTLTPRTGYGIGDYKPVFVQENAGAATGISYALPRAYDTQAFALSYAFSRIGAETAIPADKLNPHDTLLLPPRGHVGTLALAYSYSNAQRFLYGVGAERGYSLSTTFNLTDPVLASDFAGYVANADFTTYVPMPWLRHHSLALHGGGGTSGGVYPGRGAFYVGGYVDLPVVDTVQNLLVQGGFVLRGYAPVAVAGRNYVLGNAEYRFPIVNVDRGPSTLPFVLNRITGDVFLDYGTAFDDLGTAAFKTGTGGELNFDTTIGYVASLSLRAGLARGWASGGTNKLYFVAAIPY